MFMKTRNAYSKRTQNEPQLSAELDALKAEFELSNNLHVLVRASIGDRDRFEVAREREIQWTARKYENRGNEAKKCLKTKEVTSFNAANFAPFACKSTAISPIAGSLLG
jgi:hypothetical protein